MQLISMSVNNFRGIRGGLEQNTIRFEETSTVFIFGQNNVGKSSFLRAYECFYHDAVDEQDFSFNSEEDIEIELIFRIDETKEKNLINEKTNNKFEHIKENYLNENNHLRLKKIWLRPKGAKSVSQTYNYQNSAWDDKAYAGTGLQSVFQSLMLQPLPIKAMPTEPEVKMIVNDVLREVAESKFTDEKLEQLEKAKRELEKLQTEIYNPKSIKKYETDVNQKFRTLFGSYELKIAEGKSKTKYSHDKMGVDFDIGFLNTESQDNTDVTRMGHGAIRMAIFLLMILRDHLKGSSIGSKNYLILFEEPELFLHPGITKKLRSLIYEVSDVKMPFQVLCASHSPQMIDFKQDHSSIVRMVKERNTWLYQVKKEQIAKELGKTKDEIVHQIYEVLRFNPFICESFYANEVVLVEGDTEEILWRAYLQAFPETDKDIFVVNCKSCTNIPFYQKVFSKFRIPYSVICDTDHWQVEDSKGTNRNGWNGHTHNPHFKRGIQRSIANQFYSDKKLGVGRKFFVCDKNFETAHESLQEPYKYRRADQSKVVSANTYWDQIIEHKSKDEFHEIPIVKYIEEILHDSLLVKLAVWMRKMSLLKQAEAEKL